MFYQLKNKDEIILRFEVGDIQTQALGKDITEQAVLNVDIWSDNLPRAINKDDLKKSLKSWIENRKIPDTVQLGIAYRLPDRHAIQHHNGMVARRSP